MVRDTRPAVQVPHHMFVSLQDKKKIVAKQQRRDVFPAAGPLPTVLGFRTAALAPTGYAPAYG